MILLHYYNRGPPRGFGNGGIRPFISWEQGNKSLKREQAILGNIKKSRSDFGDQGKMLIFLGEEGNRQTPAPPWDGLITSYALIMTAIER